MDVPRTVRPYTELADAYNGALGFSTFRAIRSTFSGWLTGTPCASSRLRSRLRDRSVRLLPRDPVRVPVCGVDRSPEMLAVARRRCRAPRVQFLHQDIRRFRLPAPVDLATANFDTVNHLAHRLRPRQLSLLRPPAARPTGHLLFDVLTPIVRIPQGRSFEHQLPSRGCTRTRSFAGIRPASCSTCGSSAATRRAHPSSAISSGLMRPHRCARR